MDKITQYGIAAAMAFYVVKEAFSAIRLALAKTREPDQCPPVRAGNGTEAASDYEVNRAILETSRAMQELVTLMKESRSEAKESAEENAELLRECRDWHRDNHASLGRIETKLTPN